MMMALAPARCGHLTAALKALDAVAPRVLAAGWDNTGLLIDATATHSEAGPYRVFLTNDLTPAVLAEAIKANSRLIVSYHPPVFSAMKKFTFGSNHSSSVILQCARHGIAVYSPHTAIDCVKGGINDWLLEQLFKSIPALASNPSALSQRPVKETEVAAYVGQGMGDGRIVDLPPSGSSSVTLRDVISGVKASLGLERVQVALSANHLDASRAGREGVLGAAAGIAVRSIAVCAGSGSSVLSGCGADVLITGEMSHHEVLAANASGASVILTNHSNCERGYLPVFRQKLIDAWATASAAAGLSTPIEVVISAVDADPLVSC